MTEPLAFITTFEIHEGKLDEFKEIVNKSLKVAEEKGPQVMLGIYIDDAEMRAHGFQIHRDSESLLSWWQVADPYMKEAMQHLTTKRVDFYGQPSDEVVERMKNIVTSGAVVTVTRRFAGFERFGAPTAVPKA